MQKIASLGKVKIISPDLNKEPIFIVSGDSFNVSLAIFWMKLTVFCSTGFNFFSWQDKLFLNTLTTHTNNVHNNEFVSNTGLIINLQSLKFNKKCDLLLLSDNSYKREVKKTNENMTYYCCYCKQNKLKIAKGGICGHIICCSTCIELRYSDIYLRCPLCQIKIENFLIEAYSPES